MIAFLSLLTLLCFVQDGLSRSLQNGAVTNAERLARGIPLARPKRLFGSKTDSARRSMISGGPGQIIYGTIQFSYDGYTVYVTTLGVGNYRSDNSGTFVYSPPLLSGMPIEIGIVGSNGLFSVCSTIRLFHDETPANSPPVTGENWTEEYYQGSDPLETTIFYIDEDSGAITVTWINPDAQAATGLQFGIDGEANLLLTPGNPEDFNLYAVDSVTFIQTS